MLADIEITNFTAGELSPRLKGRTDYKGYYNGLDTCLNMVVLPQGGTTRRPGTTLAGLAKDQTNIPFYSRNIPFIFSTIQAYMLNFTSGNVRVCMDDGFVLSGGNPVDIAVPYTNVTLPAVRYTQSADTLYLLHASFAPATLSRSSHTSWTYAAMTFRDGPYLPVNITSTTLTPSGTSGSITLTASAVTGINATSTSAGQGFLATDIGRLVRIQLLSLWAWCVITAVTDTTHVTATVQAAVPNGAYGAIDGAPWTASTAYPAGAVVTNSGNNYMAIVAGTSASSGGPTTTVTTPILDGTVQWQYLSPGILPSKTTQWRLGKWSATTGYPQIPTFWQQRFAALGTLNQPSAVEASVSADFTNFAPTQADGTVTDANALSWIISDDQVNAIRWVSAAGSSIAMQLGIGTMGAEQIMQPATNSLPLASTNVQVYRETQIGSAPNVSALRIGKSVLFANRPGRKLMDWLWQWAINGYVAFDRTIDAEHITRPSPSSLQGICEMAYQQQPYGVIWARLGDGSLVGFTYLPEQSVFAWHRHQLGGQYYGGPPIVESVAVIPSQDGSYDEVWLSVLRTVAGVPTRTIEVMTRYFDAAALEDAFFVDAGISSALTFPINATLTPGAAAGAGVSFTTDIGAFSGAVVGSFLRVNGGLVLIKTFVTSQELIGDYWQPALDNSVRPAPPGSWSLTAQFGTFHGLDYLDGETVAVIGDGADFGTIMVNAGAITLPNSGTASLVTAGLPQTGTIIGMPFAPLRAAQSVQGRTKKIDHLYLRLLESLGCQYGQRRTDPMTGAVDDALDELETRSAGDLLGQAPALYSGVRRLPMPGGYDEEGQVEVVSNFLYPLTVLAVEARGDVGEMGQ